MTIIETGPGDLSTEKLRTAEDEDFHNGQKTRWLILGRTIGSITSDPEVGESL